MTEAKRYFVRPDARIGKVGVCNCTLPCVEMVDATAFDALAERVKVLEAGIAEWASECAGCNFGDGAKGVVLVDGFEQPCEHCADIRALLPKVTP